MLDALFDGLNIHTSYPGGEISATFTYDSGVIPEETELTAEDVDRDIIDFLAFGATPEDYDELKNQISVDGSTAFKFTMIGLTNKFLLTHPVCLN